MGIIKQGILGGFSGKVGSVVGTSWKGRAVMKAMPLSVANPKTAGQVAQRSAFKACVQFASDLLGGTILLLDNPFAGNISGYNRFVSRNTKAFDSDGEVDFLDFKISEGNLGGIGINGSPNPTDGASSVNVPVISTPNSLSLDTDKVVVACYNVTEERWENKGTVAGVRTDSSVECVVENTFESGAEYQFFVAAVRADNKYVSDSARIAVTVS